MKTVIEMARSVGATAYTNRHYPDRPTHTFNVDQLERFAELVRADAAAKEHAACMNALNALPYQRSTKYDCMDAIRARGNT